MSVLRPPLKNPPAAVYRMIKEAANALVLRYGLMGGASYSQGLKDLDLCGAVDKEGKALKCNYIILLKNSSCRRNTGFYMFLCL